MEKTQTNSLIMQPLKSGLISFILSTAFVLILALIAKIFTLPANILPVINQVLKAVAVAVGTAVSVKEEKFLVKALLGAVVFAVLNLILFVILGGEFHFGQIALDLAISLVVAAVVAFLKSRKK